MKAKKIIERIMKVINILLNIFMVCVAFLSFAHYGTSGYMYSDDINRITWMVWMFGIVNGGDYFIRKMIKNF